MAGASFYEEATAYNIDPRFPKLGGYKISSPQNYGDPGVQSQLARLDFVVLDFYFNWGVAAMNKAVDGPQTSPWQNGVYRRRFQNGMVLVNPRGNGTRTVTIEAGYRRFLGNQARTINNGNPASSITLQDRDGILLKKN